MKYESDWTKRVNKETAVEENMIANAVYRPGEIVTCRDRSFRISYAEVREGQLVYLAHGKKNSYWIPETLLLDPDRI